MEMQQSQPTIVPQPQRPTPRHTHPTVMDGYASREDQVLALKLEQALIDRITSNQAGHLVTCELANIIQGQGRAIFFKMLPGNPRLDVVFHGISQTPDGRPDGWSAILVAYVGGLKGPQLKYLCSVSALDKPRGGRIKVLEDLLQALWYQPDLMVSTYMLYRRRSYC